MGNNILVDLENNYKEFFESAESDFKQRRYNPAISSYFKAIAILCDVEIYKLRGLLPKNHTERFLFLKSYFNEAYDILSPLFKKYSDSYTMRIQRETLLEVRANVDKIKRIFGIKEEG